MSSDRHKPQADIEDTLVDSVQRQADRRRKWFSEGEPSTLRFVGQIGVLGWIIVTPTLLGLLAGRWLDHRFGTGVFWSAPLLMAGVAIGFWLSWRWMHQQ